MASTVGPISGLGKSAAVGTTFLDGLVSGFNTTEIIKQLAGVQSRPIVRLNAHKSMLSERLAAYQSLAASLTALKLAADDLATPSRFVAKALSLTGYSGTGAPLVASADSTAQQGNYQVVVHRLAQAHKISSGAVADAGAALGRAGDIRINGQTISVAADDTLTSLRDKINTSGSGVVATILTVSETDHRLQLTARQTGAANAIDLVEANGSGILQSLGLVSGSTSIKHAVANGVRSDGVSNSALDVAQALGLVIPPSGTVLINGQEIFLDFAVDSLETIRDKINTTFPVPEHPELSVTASIVTEQTGGQTVYRLQIVGDSSTPTLVDDGGVLETLGILTRPPADEKQAAQDAQIRVDGVTVTRATNSMDDVIPGVSMELVTAAPGDTMTLTVRTDTNQVVRNVQALVTAYNAVVAKINSGQAYDAETKQGGVLFGEAPIRTLEQGLRAAMMNAVTAVSGGPELLTSVGITPDRYGMLTVDTAKLKRALDRDPEAMARLFGLSVSVSGQVEYVSSTRHTADSGPAGYVVQVTRAAERAVGTSRQYSGTEGITATEVLTFDDTYHVALTAGMTLEQARDTLNGWFATYNLPYRASVTEHEGHRHLELVREQYGSSYRIKVSSSLDRGTGGTDLGGLARGEAAIYSGKDVEGTIGGEPAIGRGQYLTSADGNRLTSGLVLRVTATQSGQAGVVTVAKGAARRLSDYIASVTDSRDGLVTRGTESITRSMSDIDGEIRRVESRVQRYMDEMRVRFTRMEMALGRAQALQQYMTGQISSLAKLNSNR